MAVLRAPGHRGMDVFFSGLLDGMDPVLQAAGAAIELLIVGSPEEERVALRRWAEAGLVGGVVIADLVEDDPRPTLCRELGMPAVALGGCDDEATSAVLVDNAAAMRLGVAHLTGLGHRRLGRVSGPSRLRHTRQRDLAFAEELAARGASSETLEGDYTEERGYRATAGMLARPDRPTAIVYDNDEMAIGGLRAARDAGLAVPGDLSVLAWDDSSVSRLADPPLSVISRDVHELGGLTARALLAAAAGDLVHLVHDADAQVITRRSTGPAPR